MHSNNLYFDVHMTICEGPLIYELSLQLACDKIQHTVALKVL